MHNGAASAPGGEATWLSPSLRSVWCRCPASPCLCAETILLPVAPRSLQKSQNIPSQAKKSGEEKSNPSVLLALASPQGAEQRL